jgi:hypothetical protein
MPRLRRLTPTFQTYGSLNSGFGGSAGVAEISVFGGTQRYLTVLAETGPEIAIPFNTLPHGVPWGSTPCCW